MLDLNSRAKPGDVSALVNAAIEAAPPKPQENRAYLGASEIGASCERQIQYRYAGAPRDSEFTPKTLRIFARGHWGEELAIRDMEAAGFTIKTRGTDGEQVGFSVAGDRFAGHCDGVILAAPVAMRLPAVWEHKMLGAKGFAKASKHGVAIAYPNYAAQIAIYQAYLDLQEPALFTATSADTMERYHELVAFDAELAQRTSDKAVRILTATAAQELLPRVSDQPDWWECKFCAYQQTCWNGA